jgi:hypothetical protein
MATPLHSDPLLDLGRKIVSELGLEQTVDTLARWMAHYIAELIEDAERAGPDERPAKLAACATAIIDLWNHRSRLPDGKRPFEQIEPIMRAIESLEPGDDTPQYLRSVRSGMERAGEDGEAAKWLDAADGLDYSARILIRYCLSLAAENALEKSREWVALAQAAGLGSEAEALVIRFVSREADVPDLDRIKEVARKQIEDRLKRLDGFEKIAALLASSLRRDLKRLGSKAS